MTYYDTLAEGYDELHEAEQLAKLKILLQHVQFQGKILDVGAGTCIVAKYLGNKATVVSVDPSKQMLDKGIGERHVAKAEHLPFKDNEFDMVVSLTALHHCDLQKSLPEIKRVVKSGGTMAISFLKQAKNLPRFRQLFYKTFGECKEIDIGKDILFLSQTC